MSDLASRNEVMLLAHEIGVSESDLGFLVGDPADHLRDLRQQITAAQFARQEPRFQRLAALSRLLPAAVTAKIAEFALGAQVSGRVAGVLQPKEAVKLAQALKPDFVAALTPALDPQRVEPIVSRLPHDLTVRIGKILVSQRKHLVLGRFVAVAPLPVVLAVIDGEAPAEVLEVAMFCEDKDALQPVVDGLSDPFLAEIVTVACQGPALDDALTLLEYLDSPSCGRMVSMASQLDEPTRSRVVSRVVELGAWESVVRAFGTMTRAQIAPMVNLDAVRQEGVIDAFVMQAHKLGNPDAMVNSLLAMDPETVVAAKSSTQLKLVGIREWIMATAESNAGAVERVLDQIS